MSIIPECESSLYLNYQKTARHLQNDYDKLTRKLKMELTDSIKSIRQQIQMVNQYLEKFKEEMINLHPGSLTANIMKLIKNPAAPAKSGDLSSEMLREQYQKIIKIFPSSIDFTDARLIFTPFLCPKLDSYFNHLLLQKNDSIIPAIRELMSRASMHQEYYDFFRRWLLENYSQRRFPGSEKSYVFIAEEYYINNQAGKADSAFLNKLQDKVTRTKAILPGAIPMSLDLPDTSGNIVSFMAIKQKDIVLFIYDSDCSPCKYVKSEIKALLNRLDSRNIAVYAVDVNDDHSNWMNFIKTTGPEWIHVNGFAKKQELSSEYMLDFLPGLTLIGPDKKIIAANISFPDVEKILRSKYSFSGKDR